MLEKNTNGFLLINRELFNGVAFNNKNPMVFKLYMHCLSMAAYADHEQIVKGKKILVKTGSFITTLSKLAKELNTSKQSVRTSLKFLDLTQNLTQNLTQQFTLISVVNYEQILYRKKPMQHKTQHRTQHSATSDLYYKTNINKNIKKDDDKKGAGEKAASRRRPFGDLDFKTLWRYAKAQGVRPSKRHSYIARCCEKLNPESVLSVVGYYQETVWQRWDQRKRHQFMAVSGPIERVQRASKEQAAAHYQAIKAVLGADF